MYIIIYMSILIGLRRNINYNGWFNFFPIQMKRNFYTMGVSNNINEAISEYIADAIREKRFNREYNEYDDKQIIFVMMNNDNTYWR